MWHRLVVGFCCLFLLGSAPAPDGIKVDTPIPENQQSPRDQPADIRAPLEEIARQLSQRNDDKESILQTISLIVTLVAAVGAAGISTWTAFRLASKKDLAEKRQFCFHLQSQFDSPDMFRCRFEAWKQIKKIDTRNITSVNQLLESQAWTFEISTITHFFESLYRYCEEELLDKKLAISLFGRIYQFWDKNLYSHLIIDDKSKEYEEWFRRVRGFGDLIQQHQKQS